MEELLLHLFNFAESYTVILLWTMAPLAGIYGYIRYWGALKPKDEGKDAENRRVA